MKFKKEIPHPVRLFEECLLLALNSRLAGHQISHERKAEVDTLNNTILTIEAMAIQFSTNCL